jgi:hypothetical protein
MVREFEKGKNKFENKLILKMATASSLIIRIRKISHNSNIKIKCNGYTVPIRKPTVALGN